VLRVISGALKGRKIETLPGKGTRPVLSRVRKAVFDALQFEVPGARILDLFGGSGSYAIEALSLGAKSATIVEFDLKAFRVLVGNVQALGIKDRTECLLGDALEVIPRLSQKGKRYEYIFAAPPQGQGLITSAFTKMREHPVLAQGGLIVAQHHPKEYREGLAKEGWVLLRERRYGNTVVGFYKSS
jgi:16S rRNA (guanine966-N2)-methyltransferase